MSAAAEPASQDLPANGRVRAVVESITPQVDGGRYPAKRVLGERVVVEADVFTDGHDVVSCMVLHRPANSVEWRIAPMTFLGNDRWQGSFTPQLLGRHLYTVRAWVDHLATWQRDLAKRRDAGEEDLDIEFLRGAQLLRELAARATGPNAERILGWADALADTSRNLDDRFALAQRPSLRQAAQAYADPDLAAQYHPLLRVDVARERAAYSTWYELFPRSLGGEPGRHGTFADVEKRLPDIAAMGFDVLYLPPVHPIGETWRKGPNNSTTAAAGDPGSPWAIGAASGGHKAVHPELGTLDDFRRLVASAASHGIEIALDIAFQCSPDHPYVREHPEWFLKRPDGSIQYAENPPKKYQDIYPFDFESPAWKALWVELKSIVEFWMAQGVRIFRVDNPHTKPFGMWEWLIGEITRTRPDVIFLAEAFTRPKVMQRLAKLGFSQSYTYFAWRNTRPEIEQYFTELSRPPLSDYFRPNLWPNTPDILTEYLQFGGRPAFMIRLALAATLGASYGIYGPAFDLLEHEPRDPGSEEYRNSEKYQLRHWDLDRPGNLRDFITRVNRVRRENVALQTDRGLVFHRADNESLVVYSKAGEGGAEALLMVVNVDPHHTQSGWLELDLRALGLQGEQPFQVHDLLSGARFLWQGPRAFVILDPQETPAHVFRVRRRVRTEHDFDYFM